MVPILASSTLMWNASLKEMFCQIVENGLAGLEFWAQHFFIRNMMKPNMYVWPANSQCRR